MSLCKSSNPSLWCVALMVGVALSLPLTSAPDFSNTLFADRIEFTIGDELSGQCGSCPSSRLDTSSPHGVGAATKLTRAQSVWICSPTTSWTVPP